MSDKVSVKMSDKLGFMMLSFMHETLYDLFRDAYKVLDAAGLEPGQKVLEVGCGPGFFTVPAAKIVGEGGSVHAIDIKPLAVEKVRHKIEEAGVANAQVTLTNATRTGLPDGSFDLVFVFGFHPPAKIMEVIWAEIHRVLKPGGALAVEGRQRPPDNLFQPVERRGDISRFKRV